MLKIVLVHDKNWIITLFFEKNGENNDHNMSSLMLIMEAFLCDTLSSRSLLSPIAQI
jgi:hypothetical protein